VPPRAHTPDAAGAEPGSRLLARTFAMLDLFTEQAPEWSVPDAAAATGLPVSTAYRLTATLVGQGLLRPTGRGLRLGGYALALGRRAAAGFDLRAALRVDLVRLAADTRETAVLSVVDEDRLDALCIDRVEAQRPLRLSLEAGRVVPLHAGASSKALAAFAAPRVRDALMARRLDRLAPGTITDREALRRELDTVRRQGYAVSIEETNEGAWGLSAPILAADATLIGAVGMAGPLARHTPSVQEQARRCVTAAADSAARRLGMHRG
jgi:IclR family transcriptional regulator, acetate operon repressor